MFFGQSDHCHQWFYDGFLMLLPSLSMVFDGSGPLAKRCDGFDGSLWSKRQQEQIPVVFWAGLPRWERPTEGGKEKGVGPEGGREAARGEESPLASPCPGQRSESRRVCVCCVNCNYFEL